MHFFTLLTAGLLTITLAADPYCKEGLREGEICCPKACGICGGPKCGVRSRITKSLCCLGAIKGASKNCLTAYAPCKITHKPGHKAGSNKPDPMCKTGLMKRGACCPAECSSCGGKECSRRGRLIKSDCCVQSILVKKKSCSDRGPPCAIPEPEMPDTTTEPTKEPVPKVCLKMKTAFVGGCFCYLTITNKILVKGRKKVIALCKSLFRFRKGIIKFAPKCKRFFSGKYAAKNRMNLIARVNRLIPVCLPEGTPLIKLQEEKSPQEWIR